MKMDERKEKKCLEKKKKMKRRKEEGKMCKKNKQTR